MQRVSANAVQALKDALTAAFWFKKDLYNYAKAAVGGDPTFLAGIGWTDQDVYNATRSRRSWIDSCASRTIIRTF